MSKTGLVLRKELTFYQMKGSTFKIIKLTKTFAGASVGLPDDSTIIVHQMVHKHKKRNALIFDNKVGKNAARKFHNALAGSQCFNLYS